MFRVTQVSDKVNDQCALIKNFSQAVNKINIFYWFFIIIKELFVIVLTLQI